ncbi:hypothetical protein COO60DRAFT_1698169 [Scenedesmus sp. NREL 46B-D3]|nr:hypothetical protein COO60DRAFT_1698169 [Scenedesmus sp. NREL 46B-D3]
MCYVVTAAEFQQPGLEAAQGVEVIAPGRVVFSSDSMAGGYAAALCLRSATRVLHLIHEEDLNPNRAAGDTVYEAAREGACWQQLLQPGQTLGVHCMHFYNNSNVTNSQLVARRVRDAVCDAVRDARGVRPAPPEGAPDLPLVFQMLGDRLQLFRDLGGGSLHRRGYRTGAAVHKAALNEAAAAGLLLLAGWHERCRQEGVALADPMCGSGTLLVEAALIATGDSARPAAPALALRSMARPRHAGAVRVEQAAAGSAAAGQAGAGGLASHGRAAAGQRPSRGRAAAGGRVGDAAGMSQLIRLSQGPCGSWQPQATPSMVVSNPPWGRRLLSQEQQHEHSRSSSSSSRGAEGWGRGSREDSRGGRGGGWGSQQQQQQQQQQQADAHADDEDEELAETWQQLASFLKQQCPGAEAWVLSGSPGVTQYLGMRSSKKRSVSVGGVKTAWLKYEVREQRQQEQEGQPQEQQRERAAAWQRDQA